MSKINFNNIEQVLKRKAIGRSTLYGEIRSGKFPKPVSIGSRKIAWPEHQIDQMMQLYLHSPTEEEMRDFVKSLEAKRLAEGVANVV